MTDDSFFDRGVKPLNIDITHRCALECPRCPRQTWYRDLGNKVPGYDITLSEFRTITDYFKHLSFCGQYSDPIHHPNFIQMLRICNQKNIDTEVHVASSFKPENWFIEAFKACPDAEWIFGIDGLPHESHQYRVNQDGQKLYNMMMLARDYLRIRPVWQYIVFRYNQDHIDEAMQIAREKGCDFITINSTRWNDDDPLKPTVRK